MVRSGRQRSPSSPPQTPDAPLTRSSEQSGSGSSDSTYLEADQSDSYGSETAAGSASSPSVLQPFLPHRRSRSYVPTIPSPLNPISPRLSVGSLDSASSYDTQTEDGDGSDSFPPKGDAAAPSRRPAPPPPRRKSKGALKMHRHRLRHSLNSSRPTTPTAMSELGRDYSRYPYPRTRPVSLHSQLAFATEKAPWSIPLALAGGSALESSATVGPRDFLSGYLDDRVSGFGGLQYPLFNDEKEADDEMHMPNANDDRTFRPKLKDYMNRGAIAPCLGLVIMIFGIIALFIVLPVLRYAGLAVLPDSRPPIDPALFVNNNVYPLLKNVRQGLIDPSTPQSAMTRKAVDGSDLQLAFSDEFNTAGRTFYPGDDPFWTAPDLWYGSTQDLEWYDPDAATTLGGTLNLVLDKFENHNLQYRSGMLNSWNQLCFKGGALEVSVSLPGPSGTPGLWPGVWTMGNLGRPGYKASTDGVWPYTYAGCDVGITPNQSMTDGTSFLPCQRLPSCTCDGQDHPTPGTGRGAPEIDVFEASVDDNNRIGVVTQSYQVAPFDSGSLLALIYKANCSSLVLSQLRVHGDTQLQHDADERVHWWTIPAGHLGHHLAGKRLVRWAELSKVCFRVHAGHAGRIDRVVRRKRHLVPHAGTRGQRQRQHRTASHLRGAHVDHHEPGHQRRLDVDRLGQSDLSHDDAD